MNTEMMKCYCSDAEVKLAASHICTMMMMTEEKINSYRRCHLNTGDIISNEISAGSGHVICTESDVIKSQIYKTNSLWKTKIISDNNITKKQPLNPPLKTKTHAHVTCIPITINNKHISNTKDPENRQTLFLTLYTSNGQNLMALVSLDCQ